LAAAVAAVNPLTPLVTTTRDWLTTGAVEHFAAFVAVTAATVTFLGLGWIFYRVSLPHLVARLGN
jgi:lipopolysaccharide transport system permease protein